MIRDVAWAVQGPSRPLTRPEALVRELMTAGAVAEDARVWRHGRALASSEAERLGLPWLIAGRPATRGRRAAVLSPAMLAAFPRAAWVDLYDDWSIAPDIHPMLRALSASGYRTLRGRGVVVTVNSPYMARKVAAARPTLVPNGVEEELARLPLRGSDAPVLVVLGHFLRSRTDVPLLRSLIGLPLWRQVVIAGVTRDGRGSLSTKELVGSAADSRLEVVPRLSLAEVASLSGARTVAAVPHLVNDYTLSQDLMKVYQFLAMGLRVLTPRLLWPYGVDREHALLLDHGMDLPTALEHWLRGDPPTEAWRRQFARRHSWQQRAAHVLSLLTAEGSV